ncbi:hypothetical protein ACWGNZ_07160 [Sphingomonas zeae]
MSGFDFRDMLGGASVTLGNTPPPPIGEIGEAMLGPILALAKQHDCNPADVITSAMTHLAVCCGKAGRPDLAIDMLQHVQSIGRAVEETMREVRFGRG